MNYAQYYPNEDIALTIDLVDRNFADMSDVVVDFYHNNTLIKTLKKTETTAAKQLVAVSGQPTKFLARVFRAEIQALNLPDGYLSVAIAVIATDSNFPAGRSDKNFARFGQYKNL